MRNVIIFMVFALLTVSGIGFAHQPRLVSGITEIKNPEVSQAFYGKLNGTAYFTLKSEKQFNLYVGILVPDLKDIGKDVSVNLTRDNQTVIFLDGLAHNWTYFFEEFAGDGYYSGPEAEIIAEAGTYNIEVFSNDDEGKYVLVVGKKEEFPIDEFINTILTLPVLKADFFEKPAYTAYFNLIGIFLLVIFLVMAAFIYIAYIVYRRIKKKRKKK